MKINLYLYFGFLFVIIGVANIEQVCVEHDAVVGKETLLGCCVLRRTTLVQAGDVENVLAEEANGGGYFKLFVLTTGQTKVLLPCAVFSTRNHARAENEAAIILSKIKSKQLSQYGFPLWGFGAVGAVLCFLGLVMNLVNWLLGRASTNNKVTPE